MNLNDAQKQQVSAWIAEGLKISDIQKRLETEFGFRVTYMEVRFLLDDLKIVPKDPPAPPPPPPAPAAPAAPGASATPAQELPVDEILPAGGKVKLTVDQIARPGTAISGTVTFSDKQSGTWYLDQTGRLGLGMKQKGYRPSPEDVEDFQMQLQQELAKLGY